MLGQLYNAVFYQPVFNLLIFLYDVIPGHSLGLAIIALTLTIKLILWPFSAQALRSQKALADLQPKLDALKKQYGDKQEELGKAMMALYSQEKVSPLSSCLPVLVQMPVFISLYHSLASSLSTDPAKFAKAMQALYPFVANPGAIIDAKFLFIFDLAKSPKAMLAGVILAVLAGITQFFQARMMITRQQPKQTPGAKDEETLAAVNKQMLYMMPVLTVFLGWSLPSGLSLYWMMQNGLTIAQQKLYYRTHGGTPKKPEGEIPQIGAAK